MKDSAHWAEGEQAVRDIHVCRTKAQAQALAEVWMRRWNYLGEDRAERWFRDTYLGEGLDWFISASGDPGIPPHISSQENWHRWAKDGFPTELRRPTDTLLIKTFPKFLVNRGLQDCGPFNPVDGPEMANMVHDAESYVVDPSSYYLFYDCMFMNTSPRTRHTVTSSRVRKYLRSLVGILERRDCRSTTVAASVCHGLVRVLFYDDDGAENVSCDCKNFAYYRDCCHVRAKKALDDPSECARLALLVTPVGREPRHRIAQPTPALVPQPMSGSDTEEDDEGEPRRRGRAGGRGRGRGRARGRGRGQATGRGRGRGLNSSRGRGHSRGETSGVRKARRG